MRRVDLATTAALPAHERDPRDPGTLLSLHRSAFTTNDGIGLRPGLTLIVKDEGGGTDSKNGVYEVIDPPADRTWALRRVAWFDGNTGSGGDDAELGAMFYVKSGDANGGRWFGLQSVAAINIDPIVFAKLAIATTGVVAAPGAGPHTFGSPGYHPGYGVRRGHIAIHSKHVVRSWTIASSTGLSESTDDHILNIGWNIDGLGNPLDSTDVAWGMQIESCFRTGGVDYYEWFLLYHNQISGDTSRRPIFASVRKDTHAVTIETVGGFASFDSTRARARTVLVDSSAEATNWFWGTDQNSHVTQIFDMRADGSRKLILQRNVAGGAYIDVLMVDAADYVKLGGTSAAGVRLYSGGTKALEANATGLGFNGSAAVAKGNITGSRGGNAALANVLAYLASRGDLTDNTTA